MLSRNQMLQQNFWAFTVGDIKGGAYPGKRIKLDKGVVEDIEGEVPAQAGENPGSR